jgi:hypothetical protein
VRIVSKDKQALDLLSSPTSIRVHLVRSLALGSDAAIDGATRRSNNFFQEPVARAVFWPSLEGAPEHGERVLQGELIIKKNLKPSFLFPRFCVRVCAHALNSGLPIYPLFSSQYTLDLLPVEAAGFVPSLPAEEVLVSTKVTIVTANIPGMIPRSSAPPGYTERPSGDYNNAMGLLENGNQRFYHHMH